MDRDIKILLGVLISLILLLFVVSAAISWNQAGIQQAVWARQGCEMTQWEIFWGAKPIDRRLINEQK